MAVNLDLRVAQLLCSRVCHDLVGPSGAINAGLELMMEQSGQLDGPDGPLSLVERSAQMMGHRLAFYRVAFGSGGGGGPRPLAEAAKLSRDFLSDSTVSLEWQQIEEQALAEGGSKLLLNMVLLGHECLPRGGRLSVSFAGLDEGIGAAMVAEGPGARLKDDVRAALDPEAPADHLTARNAHAHYAQKLAESLGGLIEVADGAGDEVQLAVLLPFA
ncbi:MAG: histidine phosphotransferase family protein [Magnetovibrionaceae bacterium]